MRRPRFLRGSQRTKEPRTHSAPPPDDPTRTADRRALAAEHGWVFSARHQRAIQGWPRTALPPGPLGQVRNELSGRHDRRPFRVFDYVHRAAEDDAWHTLAVWTVALPAHMPYLEITDETAATTGPHDIYAEGPEPHFALELLSTEVSETIRRHGFRRLVIDDNELICTAAGGGPDDVASKLTALGDLVDQIPVAVWARWAR